MGNNESYGVSDALKRISQIGVDEVNRRLEEWMEQCNEHDFQLRLIKESYRSWWEMTRNYKIILILLNISSLLTFLGSHLLVALKSFINEPNFFWDSISLNLLIDSLLIASFLFMFMSVILILKTFEEGEKWQNIK